ncbi:MAG TPA: acyltransferase [Armatimonadota bacterium]|jgi:peptidoglycan/LPS O-acetylase OafA/YrhL
MNSFESTNLDFLRAIAVLLVVACHVLVFLGAPKVGIYSTEALGRLGVLIFFVHTCFVLMLSLERQDRKFGVSHRTRIFLTRRVMRIYPLSIVVVVLVAVFHLPNRHLAPGHMDIAVITSSTLLSNLALVQNLTKSISIVGPLWSLPIELQMYLLLPALFAFVTRVRSLGPLVALWVCSVVVALAIPLVENRLDVFRYSPCFLAGVIAFRMSASVDRRWPFAFLPTLLACSILVFTAHYHSGRLLTLKGAFICLAIGLVLPRLRPLANPIVCRVAHAIAKYSYGIYLTHCIALWLGAMCLAKSPAYLQWSVFTCVACATPVALYYAVERPGIRLGAALVRKRWPAVDEAGEGQSSPVAVIA